MIETVGIPLMRGHPVPQGSVTGRVLVGEKGEDSELSFTRISADGVKTGGDSRVSDGPGSSVGAWPAWSGREYAVAPYDSPPPSLGANRWDVWRQR
jgi:hypothetical protein